MHPVRCPALIYVFSPAGVSNWSWRVHGVLFWDVELPLESLAVIKCGVGHGLVIGIDAVGAVRICGFSIERWNPEGKGTRKLCGLGSVCVTCRQ